MTNTLSSPHTRSASPATNLLNQMRTVSRLFHYSNRTDLETLIRQISAQTFYFSNPSGFNDAADFDPTVVRAHDDECIDAPIFVSDENGAIRKANFPLVESTDSSIAAGIIDSRQLAYSGAAKRFRAFCLTESDAMPLMWAHYGGRSCGIAYGFDMEALAKIRAPNKIRYVDCLSLTESAAPGFDWQAPIGWRVKERAWEREQEWRLFVENIHNTEAANYVSLHGSLRSITLGINAGKDCDLCERVLAVISQFAPAIELFQVARHAGIWTTHKLN